MRTIIDKTLIVITIEGCAAAVVAIGGDARNAAGVGVGVREHGLGALEGLAELAGACDGDDGIAFFVGADKVVGLAGCVDGLARGCILVR